MIGWIYERMNIWNNEYMRRWIYERMNIWDDKYEYNEYIKYIKVTYGWDGWCEATAEGEYMAPVHG